MTRAAPWLAGGLALLVAASVVVGWSAPHRSLLDVAWLSLLGNRMVLRLDPLAAPVALFTAALAAPICFYTSAYLPPHLRERGRARSAIVGFCALMLAFMGSMLLLVCAQDLVVVFLALELSAAVSYLLIAFDREDAAARRAATIALVVTAGSSLLFAVGVVLVAARCGTTVIADVASDPRGIGTLAAVCLGLGVLAKSAQVPLHFWLPRAMIAPTPVSAYLHSAALVATGVFVLARLRVLLEGTPVLLEVLLVVGFASIFVGAALALVSDELKRVLAFSTIAQFGYAVVMVALGGADGCVGVVVFLVAHGLCKCALFLTAGALKTTMEVERLSQGGGLARRVPMLAVGSAVAAAGLAGLPLTIGWLKDDLLLGAALHRSPLVAGLATAAVALTIVYAARFWWLLFGGTPREHATRTVAAALSWPVAALAGVAVIGGLWLAPATAAFVPAGSVVAGHPIEHRLGEAYELGTHTWLTLVAWIAGAMGIALRSRWEPALANAIGVIGRSLGPERLADALSRGVRALSDFIYGIERRDLRERLTAVAWPMVGLVVLGLFADGPELPPLDPIELDDLPIMAGLFVSALAALATLRRANHVSRVILLSFVGYGLALTFALWGAPNVALVIVLVETCLTLLVLAVLWHLRPEVLERVRDRGREPGARTRGWIGPVCGVAAFGLASFTLATTHEQTVAWAHVRLAESAHAHDVVTAVLADFRGLDTAVEVTVLAIAILGAMAISWGRR